MNIKIQHILSLGFCLGLGACVGAEPLETDSSEERAALMFEAIMDFGECMEDSEASIEYEDLGGVTAQHYTPGEGEQLCPEEQDVLGELLDELDALNQAEATSEGFRASMTVECPGAGPFLPGAPSLYTCVSPGGSCTGEDYVGCTCRDFVGNIIEQYACPPEVDIWGHFYPDYWS